MRLLIIAVLGAVLAGAAQAQAPALLGVAPDTTVPQAPANETPAPVDLVALADAVMTTWQRLGTRPARVEFERAIYRFEAAARDPKTPVTAAQAHAAYLRFLKLRWVDGIKMPALIIGGLHHQRELKFKEGQRLFDTADAARAAWVAAKADYDRAKTWVPPLFDKPARYFGEVLTECTHELGRHGLSSIAQGGER